MTIQEILHYVERNGTLPVMTSTMPVVDLNELESALSVRSATLAHAIATLTPTDSFPAIIRTAVRLRYLEAACRKIPYLIAQGA